MDRDRCVSGDLLGLATRSQLGATSDRSGSPGEAPIDGSDLIEGRVTGASLFPIRVGLDDWREQRTSSLRRRTGGGTLGWSPGRPGRSRVAGSSTRRRSRGGDAKPTPPSRTPMGWEGEATWGYANNELSDMSFRTTRNERWPKMRGAAQMRVRSVCLGCEHDRIPL